MKNKIKLACEYSRVGDCVSKAFKNQRVDPATNRTIYFDDIDWEIKARTNTLSNNLDNKLYTVHHYDLDDAIIYKKDRKKIDIEEFIEGIKQGLSEAFKGTSIKIVVEDHNKKELKELIKKGIITERNVVSSKIEDKQEVDLDPFSGLEDEEVVPEETEIASLKELRETVTTNVDKKKK